MKVQVVPALQDNYIHIASDSHNNAVVVDPGDADAALTALKQAGLQPTAILVTHRHADHIGGLAAVRAAYPAAVVYAPDGCGIADAVCCGDGDTVTLLDGALSLRVAATPGHTLEHIVYIGAGLVFSGDTLFIGGCGRVFEGTMEQMYESLAKLAALPDETLIYCGHEYTVNNLRFAAAVEPQNEAISASLQGARATITVPGALAQERLTNPFLRTAEAAVIAAAEAHSGKRLASGAEVFAVLRRWKDGF